VKNADFHTFSEYMKKDSNTLTASMEDYMEMIYRISNEREFTRIHELSKALNVQPPSATNMVQRLAEMGYIHYEKYGFIMLEESGRQIGAWLLNRHIIIEEFLRTLGVSDSIVLEETEKIEHTLNKDTTTCMENFVFFMKDNQDIAHRYNLFINNNVDCPRS